MGKVSGKRYKRRLSHPVVEREVWRSVFVLELLERKGEAFERRLLPTYHQLLLWAFGDARELVRGYYAGASEEDHSAWWEWGEAIEGEDPRRIVVVTVVREIVTGILELLAEEAVLILPGEDEKGDGIRLGFQLLHETDAFCRDELHCLRSDRVPWWLMEELVESLWDSYPQLQVAQRSTGKDTESEIQLPSRPSPVTGVDSLPHEISRAESFTISLRPRQDIAQWRQSAHAYLDHILDEMLAEAESTYLHMNPSTEDRYMQDAEDLAALCVDGWQPIGEAHKKRLKRFAAFIGIDYPGQKLAMDLS